MLAIAPDAPLVLDAVYKNQDEEYLDNKALREIFVHGVREKGEQR